MKRRGVWLLMAALAFLVLGGWRLLERDRLESAVRVVRDDGPPAFMERAALDGKSQPSVSRAPTPRAEASTTEVPAAAPRAELEFPTFGSIEYREGEPFSGMFEASMTTSDFVLVSHKVQNLLRGLLQDAIDRSPQLLDQAFDSAGASEARSLGAVILRNPVRMEDGRNYMLCPPELTAELAELTDIMKVAYRSSNYQALLERELRESMAEAQPGVAYQIQYDDDGMTMRAIGVDGTRLRSSHMWMPGM